MSRVYLSGPDLFHSNAADIDANKKAICERYGLEAVSQFDIDQERRFGGDAPIATEIFNQTRALIKSCTLMVANISPFRGPSLEVSTALEIGMMLGFDKPVVGYSLDTRNYTERLMQLHNVFELPLNKESNNLTAPDGLLVENFGTAEGALISGALQSAKMPISEDFESAVRWGRRLLTD
jgi:nucleoside 2-deoxyribosyltransferase